MVHVIFSSSAAGSLRQALSAASVREKVVDLCDNLSWGPIAPADFSDRAVWFDLNMPRADDGWEWLEEEEKRFAQGLAQDSDHLLWVAPHNARELCGLHWYLDRFDGAKARMIVVGRDVSTGGPKQTIRGLGCLHPKHYEHLLRSAAPEPYDPGRFPASSWSELARDATSLRVVEDGQITSVAEDHLDAALLAEITTEWRKCHRVIAGAMISLWEEDRDTDDVFWLWRIRELSRLGVIDTNREVRYEHSPHEPMMVRKAG